MLLKLQTHFTKLFLNINSKVEHYFNAHWVLYMLVLFLFTILCPWMVKYGLFLHISSLTNLYNFAYKRFEFGWVQLFIACLQALLPFAIFLMCYFLTRTLNIHYTKLLKKNKDQIFLFSERWPNVWLVFIIFVQSIATVSFFGFWFPFFHLAYEVGVLCYKYTYFSTISSWMIHFLEFNLVNYFLAIFLLFSFSFCFYIYFQNILMNVAVNFREYLVKLETNNIDGFSVIFCVLYLFCFFVYFSFKVYFFFEA